jgi:hypothetical protein
VTTGFRVVTVVGAPQVGTGAQQVGAGLKHVGRGAQHDATGPQHVLVDWQQRAGLQQRRPAAATFPEKANSITKQTMPANFLIVNPRFFKSIVVNPVERRFHFGTNRRRFQACPGAGRGLHPRYGGGEAEATRTSRPTTRRLEFRYILSIPR